MSRTANAYNIGQPTGRCAIDDNPIEPGQTFIAALTDPPPDPDKPEPNDDALTRADISLEAWNRGQRPPHLFAFWHATMREPGKNERLVNTDNLIELFDSLDHDDTDPTPRRVAFRYTLALLLIRSRLLVQRGSRPADAHNPPALLVTRKGEPADTPPTEVTVPDLTTEDLTHLTDQLRPLIDA
jgi:hypothetical protein